MSALRTKAAGLAMLAVLALAARAERQPYSRYRTIVDRQMFGPLPKGFDPTKPPSEVLKSAQKELTKEQEQMKSAIRFSVINVTPDGQVAVGFTDSSDAKSPRNYYLKVGESRGGWLVKEADPETATMTVAKGEVEVTLTIGGDSAKDAAATAKADTAKTSTEARPPNARSPLLRTLGGRRAQRDAAAQAQAEAAQRRLEEDRKAREADREERAVEREEMRNELNDLKDLIKARREAEKAEKAAAAGGEGGGGHENDDAE